MKIAIFGASGRTGKLLAAQAVLNGLEVVAVVRDASKVAGIQGIQVVVADVFDAQQVTAALNGVDVVFDCLGSNHLGKTDVQARSIRVIIEAMKVKAIKRIIVLGASGSLHPSLCHATFGRKVFFWIIRNTFLKHPMNDSGEQQRIVEASDTDFTIVLPPRLTDEPAKGHYRVDTKGLPKDGQFLSRADLAAFMLAQLKAPQSIRSSVYVSD